MRRRPVLTPPSASLRPRTHRSCACADRLRSRPGPAGRSSCRPHLARGLISNVEVERCAQPTFVTFCKCENAIVILTSTSPRLTPKSAHAKRGRPDPTPFLPTALPTPPLILDASPNSDTLLLSCSSFAMRCLDMFNAQRSRSRRTEVHRRAVAVISLRASPRYISR